MRNPKKVTKAFTEIYRTKSPRRIRLGQITICAGIETKVENISTWEKHDGKLGYAITLRVYEVNEFTDDQYLVLVFLHE